MGLLLTGNDLKSTSHSRLSFVIQDDSVLDKYLIMFWARIFWMSINKDETISSYTHTHTPGSQLIYAFEGRIQTRVSSHLPHTAAVIL